MMKRGLLFVLAVMVVGLWAVSAQASVFLYVDAAPNVYGSPDYSAWEANAFQTAADGTFVNMANAHDPAHIGTTNFDIEDEVVYSFGDLGKRLTWVYWVPGETVDALAGTDRFAISLTNVWDGDALDFYQDYYGSTWLEPTKWQDYDVDNDGQSDGVIGTAGMAWWGAYGVNTQEALDADLAAWDPSSETWIFTARLDGEDYSMTCNRNPVPEPATMALFGLGLVGLFARKRK